MSSERNDESALLAANEGSLTEEEARKRRELLARRPSYRKIFDDISDIGSGKALKQEIPDHTFEGVQRSSDLDKFQHPSGLAARLGTIAEEQINDMPVPAATGISTTLTNGGGLVEHGPPAPPSQPPPPPQKSHPSLSMATPLSLAIGPSAASESVAPSSSGLDSSGAQQHQLTPPQYLYGQMSSPSIHQAHQGQPLNPAHLNSIISNSMVSGQGGLAPMLAANTAEHLLGLRGPPFGGGDSQQLRSPLLPNTSSGLNSADNTSLTNNQPKAAAMMNLLGPGLLPLGYPSPGGSNRNLAAAGAQSLAPSSAAAAIAFLQQQQHHQQLPQTVEGPSAGMGSDSSVCSSSPKQRKNNTPALPTGANVSPPNGFGIDYPSDNPLDETTKKRQLRLYKNREAAKECRRKKKEYLKCLENRVAVLENQNKALIEELKTLKELYCTKTTGAPLPDQI